MEPTRGLNEFTGREQISQDVRREKQYEQMAEALRPTSSCHGDTSTPSNRKEIAS